MATKTQADLAFYDYVEILYRRRWIALSVAAAVFGALAAYAFLSTPIYRAQALIQVQKPDDPIADRDVYQPYEEDFIPTQAKLILSDTALRRVYDSLSLGSSKEFSRGLIALQQATSVLPIPRTRLIYVYAESSSRRRAADIANALASNYLRQNLLNERQEARAVLAGVRARARQRDAQAFYDSLPAVAGNPRVQELKTQIVAAESELAKLRAMYTDAHPSVIAAKSQLALLRRAKTDEVAGLVTGLMTRLSGQFKPNNAHVVDAALPPEHPTRPRKRLALLLGLAGGLLLGGLAALGIETIDQTVRTHDDVERELGLPMLGHIPLTRIKRGERIYAPLINADPSAPSEAFRSLRTMVLFARAASEPCLLVTSATQEEGKSFIAANMAVSMAQLGRKVLLIDGDLRRPSQHRIFGSGAEEGLADFLGGRVADPSHLLQATEVPFLDVLSGGARVHNPSELLSSESLAALIQWARDRYDRVVIDCPPVFPVSDILLWGRHVRSSVLVARAGHTRLPLVQMACSRLHRGGIDILGGVINGSQLQTMTYADGHDFHRYCRSLPHAARDRAA